MKQIIAAKAAHRKRLAALPVPEKVRILVRMQEMAVPLLKAQGRHAVVWKTGGKGKLGISGFEETGVRGRSIQNNEANESAATPT